jgi:hypothetical protein
MTDHTPGQYEYFPFDATESDHSVGYEGQPDQTGHCYDKERNAYILLATLHSPQIYDSEKGLVRFGTVEGNGFLFRASPDLLEACESAIRFIQNGIELGYILMPEPDADDPAHDTLPKLVAAVARAKGEK